MGDSASIGEIAARAGVAPSTIRYYERLGLLPPPARVKGRRRYSADVLPALTLIRVGQVAGLTLAEMRALAGGEGSGPGDREWEALLHRKLTTVRAQIEQLRAVERMLSDALACGCLDLAACERLASHAGDSGM